MSGYLRASGRVYEGLTHSEGGEWEGQFFFVQMADTQFGFMDDPEWGGKGNFDLSEEIRLSEIAVQHINALQPKFAIVCGDLVHAYPGTRNYDVEVETFKRVFSGLDASVPLVCVCGNHDVNDSGKAPTVNTINEYTDRFGDDFFEFWAGGVCFIVLNSNVIKDPSAALDHYNLQEQWLKDTLQRARDLDAAHIVAFMHHPVFLKSPDEEDEYFNLPKERREPLLRQLEAAGVRAVFCGHYHRNTEGKSGNMDVVCLHVCVCECVCCVFSRFITLSTLYRGKELRHQ
eukprot:Opistho-2@23264